MKKITEKYLSEQEKNFHYDLINSIGNLDEFINIL